MNLAAPTNPLRSAGGKVAHPIVHTGLEKLKVRQAINHAVDRQAFVKGSLAGVGEPLAGLGAGLGSGCAAAPPAPGP